MRIAGIEMFDWMAFRGRNALEGIPAGAIAIFAAYVGNPRRSNWAGKSALLDAIRWAFWGWHRKRLDDDVIHRGAPRTSVTIRDSDGMIVTRSRERGQPTRLRVSYPVQRAEGDPGPGEVVLEGEAAQAAIDRALGIGHADAIATIILEQGDTEALVGKTSGKRREVFARWLELDLWDRIGRRARERARSASERLRGAAALPAPDLSIHRDPAAIATELDTLEVSLREAERMLADADRAHEEGIRSHRTATGGPTEAMVEAERRAAATLREEIARLGPPPDPKAGDAARADLARLTEEHGAAAAAHRAACAAISGSGFDGQCPVMGAPCPAADAVRGARSALQRRVEETRTESDRKRDARADVQKTVDAVRAAADRRASLAARYQTTVERGRALQADLEAHRARIAALPDLSVVASAARSAREVRDEIRASAERLRIEQRDANTAHEAQRVRREALASAEREARIATLASRALGPTGVPSRIASDAMRSLETRANALLIGTGLSFTLAWERETSTPVPACEGCGLPFKGKGPKACPECGEERGMKRSDELEILVDDGSGMVEDATAKSGGGRVLVAAAIRLAGGQMIRERRGSPVAWALVDEPFGPLDAENREGLARTFGSMLGSVGLEQALVVSHDAALLDALPARIIITRDGDASRVSLEV